MKNELNAEIISVGTELLLGQIVNSNAQWLSDRLASMGINVFYHVVVGDNEDRLSHQFKQAHERSDLVIVTGGLGPTDDDVTREVASTILKAPIYEDEEALKEIQEYYDANNQIMTPNNRKQARLLEGAKLLYNSVGMAPGFALHKENTTWVFLPGVPREMKAIMEENGFPFIQEKLVPEHTIFSRMLKFIGIGESQLEHDLQDLIQNQSNPTIAPLAGDGENALRLTAKASSKEEAKAIIQETEDEIMSRVGEYCYGKDHDTIQEKVFQLLKENNEVVASAESLTGGRFVDNLISLKGASSICKGGIVCYSPAVKEQVLEVPPLILDEYGSVSEACALTLSVNVADKLQSTIGISFTGVAGPEPLEGHEAGTVYIGIYKDQQQPFCKKYHFNGDREMIRQRSVKKGFELLYHFLKK
ncbi:competence/damage-inducible protein A [Pontibacillus yanchengensis]|uniref:Competence/damage-inducible protein A n=2 Tax=Pontibacillus yanchengensis TaxID=462910 RepID=A0ACC7VBC2_9BACI|nr:competence/damage-inducible protein A [Pontibacillus yanchengensis]MYL33215.1 competence/damage-inducible protein A [Pontibacillus yanchengensis]MYL51935.1 competence/damage-inducible protein A [Pontibacillus yanchengensis]